jgi:hypothetical protein
MKKIVCCLAVLVFCFGINGCGKGKNKSQVLFDQAHGQRFLVEKSDPLDLSRLADLFRAEEYHVETTKDELTPERLKDVGLLVVSGPFVPFGPEEIKAITAFLQNGGRLCVMLHIASPVAELLKELGVAISNGVVHEQENLLAQKDTDFKVMKLKQHVLTQGLTSFNVYGTWALMNVKESVSVIAESGAKSWVDLNMDRQFSAGDAMQSLGVVAAGTFGKGEFLVFGDDSIFQNQFLKGDNEGLALNMIKWVKTAR